MSTQFEEIAKTIENMSTLQLTKFANGLKNLFNLEKSEDDFSEFDGLMKSIYRLNNEETVELITFLENKFDVKAGTGIGSGNTNDDEEGSASEEKSSYAVVISKFKQEASQKVKFIQALRAQAPSIALKDAMTIFDNLIKGESHTVFDNLGKDESLAFQKAMESFVEVTLK